MCTPSPSSHMTSVPLDDFRFVSAVRWNPARRELLLTGTSVDHAAPDLSTNQRGDLRLYRSTLDDASWTELSSSYAHDPVYSPEFGYAVHSGRGVAFLDDDGNLVREAKVGRFNWGCPALSVSPSGRDLAWVRWKGDDMKPRVERISGDPTEFRTTVARYAWYSDESLLARNGSLPFLLDLASGATKRFANTVRSDLVDAPSLPEQFRELLALPDSRVWEWAGDLAVFGDRVYMDLAVTEQRTKGKRFDGLVSVDLNGENPEVLVALGPTDRFEGFDVQAESVTLFIATYNGTRVVNRRVDHLGPDSGFLADGWVPMMTSAQPSFGSHAPLSTVGRT